MPNLTLAGVMTELRDIYGIPVATYPDAKIEFLITRATREVSEYYPFNEISSLDTVANQTRYVVDKPELFKLHQVFYPKYISTSLNPFEGIIPISADPNMRNMSRAYEFIARLKLLNELYPADGLIVDHCTFDLLPTPSTTGLKVYYEYHRYRAITEIPEVLGDEVRDLVMFFLKDIAFKQRTVITGGDGYQFDRRGNVKLEKEVVDAQKNHASVEKAIIDSIKYKVMKL